MILRLGCRGSVLLAALCACGVAHADPSPEAASAYAKGAFLSAAEIGERKGDADDLALAARALLAEALIGDAPDADLVGQAIDCADRALKEDAGSVEARLQLAVALGMKGRRAGLGEALAHGYAQKGRRLISEALARDPNEPWAYALLGGWNLEVVRRGGPAGAALFGAGLSSGRKAFEKALELAPDDGAIAYQYALALLELDGVKYRNDADALLARLERWKPSDAFEERVRLLGLDVRAALHASGPDAAVRLATSRFS